MPSPELLAPERPKSKTRERIARQNLARQKERAAVFCKKGYIDVSVKSGDRRTFLAHPDPKVDQIVILNGNEITVTDSAGMKAAMEEKNDVGTDTEEKFSKSLLKSWHREKGEAKTCPICHNPLMGATDCSNCGHDIHSPDRN